MSDHWLGNSMDVYHDFNQRDTFLFYERMAFLMGPTTFGRLRWKGHEREAGTYLLLALRTRRLRTWATYTWAAMRETFLAEWHRELGTTESVTTHHNHVHVALTGITS